jgi:hypothetical protein
MRAKNSIQFSLCLTVMLCALMVQNSHASNVGVMGETYSIIEEDFLDFIQSRAAMMQKNGHGSF